ncbi:MAG: macrolide ABC transporter ATP-binding protein [Deltaproteobacteria bacterium]|jgi:putative ABC transport system ATP-binding protein|nr:macrolide ABC transporter ATP-binding protein [Deltaproteobacteria bacterium]
MSLLALRQVRKRFRLGEQEVEILRGVDLAIEAGEFLAIMGPSGSGKTTCLEILGALSRPSEGSICFEDEPVEDWSDDALADLRAQRLGFVFQTFNLMPRMSALRNAALPLLYAGVARAEREDRARLLLERVGLGHRIHHRPAQLSGGERQRVAIARALVNEPRVILADEPTGNLDEATSGEILALFEALHAEGRTLVVVTHSDEVAARAGRVIRLRDGRVTGIAA